MALTQARTGTDPKISLNYPDGSLIVRSREIPWTPWGMPGTQFKLLHCDDASSLLVILLKVEPGTVAGVHKHFGAAHAYILEGGFGYEHGEVFPATTWSRPAASRTSLSPVPTACCCWVCMFGPIGGFDDNGNLAGVLDIEWHYQAALANGAAGHIQRKSKAAAPAH